MAYLFEKLRFSWRHQRAIMFIAVAATGATWVTMRPRAPSEALGWWTALDAAITVATLGVAILVWATELAENWEKSLPMRLKVVYKHDSKPAMVCEDSTLVSEADIRAMALQMGAQITGDRDLKLGPVLDVFPPVVQRDVRGTIVRRYEIHLVLNELPQRVRQARLEARNPAVVIVRRLERGVIQDSETAGYTDVQGAVPVPAIPVVSDGPSPPVSA